MPNNMDTVKTTKLTEIPGNNKPKVRSVSVT
jgi:hypothetical protein